MITAALHHTEDVTPRLRTFWFTTEQPFQFTPGEYVEMYLPHDSDNRGELRKFTISSMPGQTLLGFTIALAKHSSSFKQALLKLHPGETVSISEAIGDFVFPKLPTIPIIGVAAGSGITPFMSMCRDPQQAERQVDIIHIVRSPEDVVRVPSTTFTEYILPPTETLRWQRLQPIDNVSEDTLFYLAGPEQIIDSLKSELLQQGIAPYRIITDLFIGATNL